MSDTNGERRLIPRPPWDVAIAYDTLSSDIRRRGIRWRAIHQTSDGQLVLYNPATRALAVGSHDDLNDVVFNDVETIERGGGGVIGNAINCPTCGKPWTMSTSNNSDEVARWSMDHEYFELIGSSLRYTMAEDEAVAATETIRDNDNSRDTEAATSPNIEGVEHLNSNYYATFFIERKRLGSGLRGQVFKCHHVINGLELGWYAVKKVPVGNNRTWLARMLAEVHVLEKISRHPNIIDYKHTWVEEHCMSALAPSVPVLFILMHYANAGNLAQFLWPPQETIYQRAKRRVSRSSNPLNASSRHVNDHSNVNNGSDVIGSKMATSPDVCKDTSRRLSEAQIGRLFIDVMLGVNHLHTHGIIHRDLKPENILLHKDESDCSNTEDLPRALISDFGETQTLETLSAGFLDRTGYTGTVEYTAPELLRRDQHGRLSKDYDFKADVWSAGLILYALCFGCLPWTNSSSMSQSLVDEIVTFESVSFPDEVTSHDGTAYSIALVEVTVSSQLKTLISAMLNPDPIMRPTAFDVLLSMGVFAKVPQRTPAATETVNNDESCHDVQQDEESGVIDGDIGSCSNETNGSTERCMLVPALCSVPAVITRIDSFGDMLVRDISSGGDKDDNNDGIEFSRNQLQPIDNLDPLPDDDNQFSVIVVGAASVAFGAVLGSLGTVIIDRMWRWSLDR